MQIEDFRFKTSCLISFKERLELFNKTLPENVAFIRELYFDTYDSHLEFWSDSNRMIQRLDSYEDELLLEESVLITQEEYLVLLKNIKLRENKLQLNLEQFESVQEAGCEANSHNPWKMISEGEWTQNNKMQYQTCIVQDTRTEKYYEYEISRSGSPFSDWHYSHEDEGEVWLTEVVSQTKTITVTEWVAV